jgi:hypothetical protein
VPILQGAVHDTRKVDLDPFLHAAFKEGAMRIITIIAVMVSVSIVFGGCATFQNPGPAETVTFGCKTQIDSYCRDVAQGDGLVLTCLHAYIDKLSGRCLYALYDAVSQLQWAVKTLPYVANECQDDIKAYCSHIEPGDWRILWCLDRNKDKVSDRCKEAERKTT